MVESKSWLTVINFNRKLLDTMKNWVMNKEFILCQK